MIVGFAGPLRAGKTTAAYWLQDKYDFTRAPFAEPLKVEVTTRLRRTLKAHLKPSIDSTYLKNMTEKDWDERIYRLIYVDRDDFARSLLQEYGTEVRRADDMNYWVNRWHEFVTVKDGDYVSDDTRFVNEAKIIRDLGGKLIRIERPSLKNDPTVMTHESENGLKTWTDYDSVVVNDGTIQDLWMKVDLLAAGWGLKMLATR